MTLTAPGDVMQNLTFDGSTIMSAGWIGQVVLTLGLVSWTRTFYVRIDLIP